MCNMFYLDTKPRTFESFKLKPNFHKFSNKYNIVIIYIIVKNYNKLAVFIDDTENPRWNRTYVSR